MRDGLQLRGLHIAVGVVTASTIWLRRSRPLHAVATAFGLAIAMTVLQMARALPRESLHSTAVLLLLPYSLFRWGSGREAASGLAIILSTYLIAGISGEMHGLSEWVGAAVVLLFPGALGTAVRFRAEMHRRDIENAKLGERGELARDLHDTVAHHVSAIAVQAQAARAVLAVRPEATARALEAIEKEASRTLLELRSMVGALRNDRRASLTPLPGIAEIVRLADDRTQNGPAVEVEIEDGLERLRPVVQSALYRIAQESITNALRHARGATKVHIRVATFEKTKVRLTVEDDGAPGASSPSEGGMGIVGMTERAELLGGTLRAGPRSDGGFLVEAVLPEGGKR